MSGRPWMLPLLAALALALAGCVGTPTPLAPGIHGSVGFPHEGVITNAVALPRKGQGYALLRHNGRNWGNPRLVAAIEGAAGAVARARPGGAPLMIGDMSARWGGAASGHRSHRTGRDADLLIYVLTPDGRSIPSPGFLRFGPDGLAELAKGKYARIDLEREWQLVKALVTSREANVQWLFFARWLEALVIEYARARGEDPELVLVRRERPAPARRQRRARRSPPPAHRLHARRGGRRLPRRRALLAVAPPPPAARPAAGRGARAGHRRRPPGAVARRGARVHRRASSRSATRSTSARALPEEARFDLVYLDPPYGVGATMTARVEAGQARGRRRPESGPEAYEDRDDPDALVAMLAPRLAAIRDRMAQARRSTSTSTTARSTRPRSRPIASSAAARSSAR